jgi:hypothetical protein
LSLTLHFLWQTEIGEEKKRKKGLFGGGERTVVRANDVNGFILRERKSTFRHFLISSSEIKQERKGSGKKSE